MKNGKLLIGIIGCGGIANNKHLPSLAKLGELCEMTAFCDIKVERAEEAAKKYGAADAKIYSDYKELLNDDSIDVVHVLTPNVFHGPITVDSFNAGKHVMCEKPMAHTAADAKKMLDAAKKSGKKFTIGYQNRFRNEVQTLHKACETGALGDIYMAKAHAVRRRAVPTWGVFPDKSLQGGGPLIDIGTHALDITLWMMNNYKPKSITGSVFYKMADKFEGNLFGPWDPKTFEVEDSAFGFIKMENGATIFLEAAWALNVLDSKEAATTLMGTEAGAEIRSGMSYAQNELIINNSKYGNLFEEKISGGGHIAYFEGASNEPGYLEARQWLLSIINDTEPLVKPEQAFVVTQILECIYKSHETGKMIEL
ncbi:putative dehydrogenase [Anaerobacterium chartisolvens]|uniref:Putative dehydrogenase n=1 Tax=Anaerobacterium chartisolvens TaxID=1297424 RepID=A0A369B386_9FIRM|nr:Gfo/Idh/MocA family oxidoreductase [Anaerobacterium chartisolvens]RCX16062.1 putative dehydrogenase [Anaerobacterium chartisolvens]